MLTLGTQICYLNFRRSCSRMGSSWPRELLVRWVSIVPVAFPSPANQGFPRYYHYPKPSDFGDVCKLDCLKTANLFESVDATVAAAYTTFGLCALQMVIVFARPLPPSPSPPNPPQGFFIYILLCLDQGVLTENSSDLGGRAYRSRLRARDRAWDRARLVDSPLVDEKSRLAPRKKAPMWQQDPAPRGDHAAAFDGAFLWRLRESMANMVWCRVKVSWFLYGLYYPPHLSAKTLHSGPSLPVAVYPFTATTYLCAERERSERAAASFRLQQIRLGSELAFVT